MIIVDSKWNDKMHFFFYYVKIISYLNAYYNIVKVELLFSLTIHLKIILIVSLTFFYYQLIKKNYFDLAYK